MVAVATPRLSLGRQTWNFGRHYLEMCIAMCVAGVPLTLATLAGLSSLAGTSVRELYPALSLVVMAFTLTLPMSAWMLFRGMPRRPTAEMATAAFLVAFLLIGGVGIGIVSEGALALTVGEFCGLSCVAMLGVMILRLDVFTGRTGQHMAHAA